MYTMYTRQLSDAIKKDDVIHHSYADDTQIYIHSEDNPKAHREATDKLQRCIAEKNPIKASSVLKFCKLVSFWFLNIYIL